MVEGASKRPVAGAKVGLRYFSSGWSTLVLLATTGADGYRHKALPSVSKSVGIVAERGIGVAFFWTGKAPEARRNHRFRMCDPLAGYSVWFSATELTVSKPGRTEA